jgi:hypothetical protein
MFFLVSGAAASGKTTASRGLKGRIENLEVHDADEKAAQDEFSRCSQLEEWVQLALQNQPAGRDFLLTTHSPLGELLACPSAPLLDAICACLIDCSDPVRITRMRRRGIDPRWPPSQDVVSWAAWHRLHAWDPRWEQPVIIGNGPTQHAYTRWTHWDQTDPRWQVTIIDTTHADTDHLLELVTAWISGERQKIQLLTPQTKWWQKGIITQ